MKGKDQESNQCTAASARGSGSNATLFFVAKYVRTYLSSFKEPHTTILSGISL